MPNTVDDYNIFFETDRGQRVLANMLLEGGFFRHTKTEGEQAVQNFLKTVLAKTGRYPIDEERGSFERAIQMISGLKKRRSALDFVKNLIRLRKIY
jgi:hypothetical protein